MFAPRYRTPSACQMPQNTVSLYKTQTGRKEGNVLFNDALNTFYLRLYGVRHMVNDHSDSERENPLPLHGLLFPISSKGSFIRIILHTGYHIPRPLLHHFRVNIDNCVFLSIKHFGQINPFASLVKRERDVAPW